MWRVGRLPAYAGCGDGSVPHGVPTVTPDPVTAYATDVVAGKIVAGKPVRQACQRHLTDVATAAERRLQWVPERATHALEFFKELLVLPDGPHAGEPFELASW